MLWPSRLALLLPLLAAAFQFLTRGRLSSNRRLAISTLLLVLVAGLALTHFWVSEQFTCMFVSEAGNCFVNGLGSLASALLMFGLAVVLFRRGVKESSAPDLNHARLLVFVAAFTGFSIGENLLIAILSLLGLYTSLDYLLRNRGLRWGFLVIRDDYKGDIS